MVRREMLLNGREGVGTSVSRDFWSAFRYDGQMKE